MFTSQEMQLLHDLISEKEKDIKDGVREALDHDIDLARRGINVLAELNILHKKVQQLKYHLEKEAGEKGGKLISQNSAVKK